MIIEPSLKICPNCKSNYIDYNLISYNNSDSSKEEIENTLREYDKSNLIKCLKCGLIYEQRDAIESENKKLLGLYKKYHSQTLDDLRPMSKKAADILKGIRGEVPESIKKEYEYYQTIKHQIIKAPIRVQIKKIANTCKNHFETNTQYDPIDDILESIDKKTNNDLKFQKMNFEEYESKNKILELIYKIRNHTDYKNIYLNLDEYSSKDIILDKMITEIVNLSEVEYKKFWILYIADYDFFKEIIEDVKKILRILDIYEKYELKSKYLKFD